MEYPSHFLRGHLRKMTFMDCWLHTAYEQNLKKKVKLKKKKCFKSNYIRMNEITHMFLWEVLTFDNQNELSAMGLKIQLQSWSQKKKSFSQIFTTQNRVIWWIFKSKFKINLWIDKNIILLEHYMLTEFEGHLQN